MSDLYKQLGVMPLSTEIYTKSAVDDLVNNAVTGGVTSLLKFVGISSTDPLSEGGATVTGVSAFAEGNVVLWKPEGSSEYSEYVYATVDGSLKWERLGDASRIGQLEQRVSTAESDIEALEGRVTTAEGEIDALQADIATKAAAADLTALAGRVTTAEGEIDALQADIATKAASADLTALAGRVTTAEGEIDALQADIVKKADISALNDGLALKADLTALNAIDGRVTAVEGAVATKAEASVVEGIDSRLSAAEGEIDALQGEMAQAKIDIAANTKLINDNKTATDAAIALKADITALDAVSTTVSELSGKVDSNQAYCDEQFQTLGGQISTLESEVVPGINGRIDDLDSRLGDLNQSVTNCVTSETFQNVTSGLASRLTTAEGEIDALQADIATKAAAADLTALDGEVEALAGRVTTAEGEIDGLQAEIANKANASDVVAKDKLLVLTEQDGSQYFIGSQAIRLSNDSGAGITITPDGGISGQDGMGNNWLVEPVGLQFGIDGGSHAGVSVDGIDLRNLENHAIFSASNISLAGSDGSYLEITYPDAGGQLATVEGMAEKYDSAVEATDTIYSAAGTATAALADVTNVNELISVLNTFFGTIGA